MFTRDLTEPPLPQKKESDTFGWGSVGFIVYIGIVYLLLFQNIEIPESATLFFFFIALIVACIPILIIGLIAAALEQWKK